ncbi:response regulator transcription factor [Terrihabitans rhizophilus]|uniref:Response regulator transcription factor n=1 Tax=Terrihabitans rhizophilus TaxID=3092662 RepID=A0ABU4RNJ0_9HYPH|nr:response regulator transcription factor [Terrihabitans sp. PJ23]MDX6806393.1 response regulator transcription factor [Terrihabitans sp. PJ23]
MTEGNGGGLPDGAAHILVVDDDARIRDLLARYLAENGYRVSKAASAQEALTKASGLVFDLLIVDVMMPGQSGLELATAVRAGSDVPILMLTALGEPNDRINGLETGADDYVTKPFVPRELLLRVASLLRRSTQPQRPTGGETVVFGDFRFHLSRGELRRGADIIHITERERDLLRQLAEQRGGAVSREALGGGGAGSERAVDVQINRLRRKIEDDPAQPLLLQTVRGSGYRLMVDL